ncbi:MAG: MBL fold metallo-hydrolase [Steroidobacteraceae bacterium]
MDRRVFISSVSGALLGTALAGCQSAPARQAPTAFALADRVRVLSGVPGNVTVVSTTNGFVLIDSGSVELAPQVHEGLGRGRVRALYNTHHHADQTGGNALFGAAGATIHSHAIAREWLETDYYVPGENRWVKALPAAARPTATFRTADAATIGGQHIEAGYLLEAHTRGDIYVHLRDANVLCVGDVASPLRDPVFDWYAGGWVGARVDALDVLLKRSDDATRIVPAYGPVMTRAELQAERDLMLKLFERTGKLLMEGHSAQDMLAAGVLKDLGREFTDPDRLLYDVSKGLWAHYTNFGGRSV